MEYTLLYRSSLESCNYRCSYCPFAGKNAAVNTLEVDIKGLLRFKDFIKNSPYNYRIFFTPRGEALIYKHYREAVKELSTFPNVKKIAVQSNNTFPSGWLEESKVKKIGLWLTFHPGQTDIEDFVERCRKFYKMNIRFSCGMVGIKENFKYIEILRELLPEQVYLWINAYKRIEDYYSKDEINFLNKIDPFFDYNLKYYKSYNKECLTGYNVFSLDENGEVKRCHFTTCVMGNIYKNDLSEISSKIPCTNQTCHCHIGYIFLPELKMDKIFGDGILERAPLEYKLKPCSSISTSCRRC